MIVSHYLNQLGRLALLVPVTHLIAPVKVLLCQTDYWHSLKFTRVTSSQSFRVLPIWAFITPPMSPVDLTTY